MEPPGLAPKDLSFHHKIYRGFLPRQLKGKTSNSYSVLLFYNRIEKVDLAL
jgi:hypothetical protein